ncbi:MAG: MarR family transcriptional regulator [Alphaproteobacteria bacterium]|nr:MAG: MarR family transcriptional regulator [Alphaproteobacteria bacterium]
MKAEYLTAIALAERTHRQFLDVIGAELARGGVEDINAVQALILFNIGSDQVTMGDLTARGYYLGSNVSYNVRRMTEAGYLEQYRPEHDRRTVRVRLTEKGRALQVLLDRMFDAQVHALSAEGIGHGLADSNRCLSELEAFWAGLMRQPAIRR